MVVSRQHDDANAISSLAGRERRPILLAGGLVALGSLSLMFWYFQPLLSTQYDDSYITYRYAWNLFQGDGLVFNVGDKVNSASSLLYVLMLAALGPLGHEVLPDASAVIGVASFIGLGAVFIATGLHLRRSPHGLLIGIGAASIALINATNAYWALSGMETALFNLLLATSLVLTTLPDAQRPQRRLIAVTISLVLLAVTRPEGIAIAGAVATGWVIRCLLIRERDWLRALIPFVAVTLTGASYLLFNVVYYGSVIPNSVLFKTMSDYYTTDMAENLASIAVYFGVRLGPVVTLAAAGGLATALVCGPGRAVARLAQLLPGILGGLALLLFLLSASYSDQYRYLTPLSVLASWCFVQWATADGLFERPRALRRVSVLVLSLIVVGLCWQVLVAGRIQAASAPFLETQRAREEMGRWLEANTPSGTRILAGDLGSLAYWNPSNTYIDSSGLTNRQLLRGLQEGVPYAEIIQRQSPDLVVDTVDPSGRIGSIETFNAPRGYFDQDAILPVPGPPFDSVYRLALVRESPDTADRSFSVTAFRLLPQPQ